MNTPVSIHTALAADMKLLPPTVSVSLNNEGLLPVTSLNNPIAVTFPVWAIVALNTSYQLLWDQRPIGLVKLIQADDKPGDILTLDIPVEVLTAGEHQLAYRLLNLENGVQTDSPSTPIKIDRTAPGDPLLAPILFPTSVANGLTADELQALGNVLPGTIAGYTGMQEGDVIRTYWGGVAGPVAVVGKNDMGLKRVMVDFSEAFLLDVGDVEAAVYYTVTDLAGNLSMDAQPVPVVLQLQTLPELPFPVVREANGDTLDPVDAARGATVVVGASAQLASGDRVMVQWSGPKGSDARERRINAEEAGKEIALAFSSALVEINAGEKVDIFYSIYRSHGGEQRSATLTLQILQSSQELVFDTSPVILDGKVYIIPQSSVLPAFPANATVRRVASGGQPPYRYSSSDENIAFVDDTGLASVRGNGLAAITVTDTNGRTKSYPLTVTGVTHCLGLGGGNHAQISAAATRQAARLPSKAELDQVYAAFGNRWPIGNFSYWSTTVVAQNLLGHKWYATKNLVTGSDIKLKYSSQALGVGLR
jgi:hypothetical protein